MLLLYCPCPSGAHAERMGKALVGEKLAACANVIPSMTSYFWWEGRLEKSREALLLCKVSDRKKRRVERRVKQLHPYSLPCICFYHAAAVNAQYERWVSKNSR